MARKRVTGAGSCATEAPASGFHLDVAALRPLPSCGLQLFGRKEALRHREEDAFLDREVFQYQFCEGRHRAAPKLVPCPREVGQTGPDRRMFVPHRGENLCDTGLGRQETVEQQIILNHGMTGQRLFQQSETERDCGGAEFMLLTDEAQEHPPDHAVLTPKRIDQIHRGGTLDMDNSAYYRVPDHVIVK